MVVIVVNNLDAVENCVVYVCVLLGFELHSGPGSIGPFIQNVAILKKYLVDFRGEGRVNVRRLQQVPQVIGVPNLGRCRGRTPQCLTTDQSRMTCTSIQLLDAQNGLAGPVVWLAHCVVMSKKKQTELGTKLWRYKPLDVHKVTLSLIACWISRGERGLRGSEPGNRDLRLRTWLRISVLSWDLSCHDSANTFEQIISWCDLPIWGIHLQPLTCPCRSRSLARIS